MIISVQNQKGGVGKSTLSISICYWLAQGQKKAVLLVDADPQGSARDWAAARESKPPFALVAMDRPTVHRDLPAIAKDYDHVIIDGPPRVTDLARSCIIASDLVLIPVQPSPYDVWAAKEIVDLIKEASVFKETLKSVFVINRKVVNTAIGRDVVEILGQFEIPVLESVVCQRIIFAESAASGQTVFEVEPKGAAAREIKDVANEVLKFGG